MVMPMAIKLLPSMDSWFILIFLQANMEMLAIINLSVTSSEIRRPKRDSETSWKKGEGYYLRGRSKLNSKPALSNIVKIQKTTNQKMVARKRKARAVAKRNEPPKGANEN